MNPVRVSGLRLASALSMEPSPRAVLRHEQGQDRFTLSFVLRLEQVAPGAQDKQFNLSRPLEEPGEQFLGRLNSNVDKVVKKMTKKKKSEAPLDAEARLEEEGEGDNRAVDLSSGVAIGEVILRGGLQLVVLGQRFPIAVNPPLVERMSIPDAAIMAGFPVYPRKLVLLNADEEESTFV